MTKKVLIIIFALVVFINSRALANPNIESGSAMLMEADTGQILYDKNSNVKQYPASITKVLTAIIALEHNELEDVVVVGNDVPNQIESGSSAIYLIPDEKLTMEQLMYGLLVESGNDVAVAIAEQTSGSVEEFSKLMNAKAKALGANDSNFVNPHGLHNENHYTTAHDMALIMREAIKNPILLNLMTTKNYIIPETNKQDTRYLWTKNRLYRSDTGEFFYDKVIASKTGFTSVARNTLLSAAEENGMRLIAVVLQSNGVASYSDTINMFEYGFDNFVTSTLVNKNEFIQEYSIQDATSPLKIVSRSTVKYVVNKDNDKEIVASINISKDLSPSIKEGEKIGTVEYSLDATKIAEADLVSGNELESVNSVRFNKIIKSLVWVLPGILGLYIFARLYVFVKNTQIRKRRYKRQSAIKYIKKSSNNEYSKY
ncbi:D-alanyl-D-alanine carboxypeptidase family protein [Alkalibaculum sporogenes]|nr:D-alanyl-D-alanine carboxypeptidase family protein [Alkalibaculum sporogenes]